MLGLGDVELEGDRSPHDFVGRSLVDAAGVVVAAQMPAMCPLGGTKMFWPVAGSNTLIQGQ